MPTKHSNARRRKARWRKPNPASARNPVTPALIRKIADLTDRNLHTQAVTELARALRQRREAKTPEAIETVWGYMGEMPPDLMRLRGEILLSLLARAQEVAPRATVAALNRAF